MMLIVLMFMMTIAVVDIVLMIVVQFADGLAARVLRSPAISGKNPNLFSMFSSNLIRAYW